MLNKKAGLAISQVFILVIGIIAIGWVIGSEARVVSGLKFVEDDIETIYQLGLISKLVPTETSATPVPSSSGNTKPTSPTPGAEPTTPVPSIWKRAYGFHEAEGVKGGEEWVWAQGNFADAIVSGAAYAITAYTAVKIIGGFLGVDEKKLNAVATAAGWGFFAGRGIQNLASVNPKWIKWAKFGGEGKYFGLTKDATALGWGVGLTVAAIIFFSMYKKESTEVITFTCEPWEAPTGGSNCEKCNKQGILPCSEYQCRSLGQSCQLLNQGTEDAKCTWINRNDVKPPIIKPWDDALLYDYEYKPDKTISPPDTGVKVWNKDSTTGCVKAFTPLAFGIITDEPTQCKLDYTRKRNFEDMQFYFGGSSLFKYNHTQIMSLPGPDALAAENLTLQNDGEFKAYVRCQDSNGNANTANFVFKYCVEKGPDTTPPLIVTTNLLNGMPIAFNQSSIDLEIYINEPADCKWSHLDQNYENMENDMACSSSVFEMNAQMLYKCSTTLTGLKNRQENKFYFRCKDQPTASEEDRNVNAESYEFILLGTRPLVIDEVGPNETVQDSTELVKVTLTAKTSAGYKEGEAICQYSDTGEEGSYIDFLNTNSYQHSQELWLAKGDYEYWIKCFDLGGNSDINKTKFRVEPDSSPPRVIRAYKEETYLKIVTNEKAECVYDTMNCNYLFDDGIAMKSIDGTKHFTDWSTETSLYIKCKDEYGNQPAPNECSIAIRPMKNYL